MDQVVLLWSRHAKAGFKPLMRIRCKQRVELILKEGLYSNNGGKVDRKYIEQQWLALRSAFDIGFPVCHLDLKDPHGSEAWKGLVDMVDWLLVAWFDQGAYFVGKALKAFASQCQSRAVGDVSRAKAVPGAIPDFFSFIRGSLVSGLTAQNLWTFSNLGRSIPPPPPSYDAETSEYTDWVGRLWDESVSPTDPEVLKTIRRRTALLMTSMKKGAEHAGFGVENYFSNPNLNASACLERSRAKGGVYGHYKSRAIQQKDGAFAEDLADKPWPPELDTEGRRKLILPRGSTSYFLTNRLDNDGVFRKDDKAVPPRGTAPDWARTYALDRVQNRLAEDDLLEDLTVDGPVLMRPVLLRERGQKIRLATMSPAPLVVAGQRLNKTILTLFKHSKALNYSLLGHSGVPGSIRAAVASGVSDKNEFLSTDLSAASDYIPHDVAGAVWEGIWEVLGEGYPPYYHDVGHRLLGPQRLEDDMDRRHDVLRGVENKSTTRGILMGLPLTWPVLSILNLLAAKEATSTYSRLTADNCGFLGSKHWTTTCVCGDDMGAYWPIPCTQLYFDALESYGLKVNFKKTYRSPNGLIFVEELFKLGSVRQERPSEEESPPPLPGRPQTNQVWLWIEVELRRRGVTTRSYQKVAVVTRPRLSAILFAKKFGQKGDDVSPLWQILPRVACEQVGLAREPWRQKRVLEVVKRVHRKVITSMEKTGLPLHWPKCLGGWGLPGRQGASTKFRKVAASILYGKDPTGTMRTLSRAHLHGGLPDLVRRPFDRAMDLIENHQQDIETYVRGDGLSEYKDVEEEVLLRVVSFLSRHPDYDKSATAPVSTMSSTVARVSRLVKTLGDRWRSAAPMQISNVLLKYLDFQYGTELVRDDQLEEILHWTGIRDTYLTKVVSNVAPEERNRIYDPVPQHTLFRERVRKQTSNTTQPQGRSPWGSFTNSDETSSVNSDPNWTPVHSPISISEDD
jgi:hypothetical protein